jgi:hypothetical protein
LSEPIKKGTNIEHLLASGQHSPATCCLVNPYKEKTVEKAFALINHLSQVLKEKYALLSDDRAQMSDDRKQKTEDR